MKSFCVPGLCLALGLVGLVQPLAAGEPFGSASLLPMPSVQQPQPIYPMVTPASYGGSQEEISPSDHPPAALAPPSVGFSKDYQQAMKGAWDGAGCTDGSCGEAIDCCGRCCPRWAVWTGGMVLARANQCDRPVTLDAGTMQNVMSTNAAEQDWSGGVDVGAAWIMPNCCNAISVNYWGLYPTNQRAATDAANTVGGISPVLGNANQLNYSDGTVTDNVFNWMSTASGTHEVAMGGTFHSVEINFLANTQAWGLVPFGTGGGGCNSCNAGNSCDPCGSCCPSCWQFGWLAGVRYFNFNEYFLLQTDVDDAVIGDPGDTSELNYRIDTNNNLWGFQFGGQGAWYICNCFSIYGSGRFGVFNNHITSEQFMTGAAGDATIDSGDFAGTPVRYSTSANALAGMGQFDLGTRYQLGCRWSIYGGYRVVGLSGVATAPGQIPANWGAPVTDVCAGSNVILHGTYMGAQFTW